MIKKDETKVDAVERHLKETRLSASVSVLCSRCKCSRSTVFKAIKKHNLKKWRQGRKVYYVHPNIIICDGV